MVNVIFMTGQYIRENENFQAGKMIWTVFFAGMTAFFQFMDF